MPFHKPLILLLSHYKIIFHLYVAFEWEMEEEKKTLSFPLIEIWISYVTKVGNQRRRYEGVEV